MQGFTEGRIVHFVLPNGEHRPAIIVKAWPQGSGCEGYANLQVFTDFGNDVRAFKSEDYPADVIDLIRNGRHWATSVCFDDQEMKPRTWHWIEPA